MPLWPFRKKPRAAPEPPNVVAAVVPCAGNSTRMGTSKALLDAGGRSFLAAVVGSLVAGGCDPVVVVLGEGMSDEERRAKAAGAIPVVNPDPGEGPITSLRLGMALLEGSAEGIAFLPVDHPKVQPETVQKLVATFLDGAAPLVVPIHDGKRGHPVIVRRSLFAELRDPSLKGGARTVVHAHLDEAELVPVDDPGVLLDVDTRTEYEAIFGSPRESA